MTLLSKWEGEEQDARDLTRKFVNTFVKASIPGMKPIPVLVKQIGDGIVSYIAADAKPAREGGVKVRAVAAMNEFDIVCAIPQSGLYEVDGGGVALLRRNPLRQYHEGICAGSVSILMNDEHVVAAGGMYGWHIIEGVFAEQRDRNLFESLKEIKPGENIRLTEKYWLRNDKAAKITSLWSTRTRVGSWSVGKFFWSAEGKILREELKDALDFHAK